MKLIPVSLRLGMIGALLFSLAPEARALDPMWVFTVQITAAVQASPPQITLSWPPDQYGASSYTVYRKAKTDTAWGSPIAALAGTATSYIDHNVSVGGDYEYQIIKTASAYGTFNYTGYGYLYSGIQAPMIENRGTLILVVETNATAGLSLELARLRSDLVGDGWQVISHGVSSNNTPASVKSLIVADYRADPAHVNAVFLFGHVPILESGNLNYDGHGARPMPADAYYGDMTGDWSSLPSYLPANVNLEVGRVDLFNMPGNGASIPFPSETEMLRNYLNKDHNWRFGLIRVPRLALMADRFGNSDNGEPKAATGYRSFAAFVGLETADPTQGNTIQADVSDTAVPANRWISMLTNNAYLWACTCSGGFETGQSELGFHGLYNDVWTTDIVNDDPKCVFYLLEGSHFGQWDVTDDFERSVLATPTMGLAVCSLAGHPHWFMHHVGLGETLGYGARLSMNNSTMYQTWSNNFERAIYVSLLGDPALRMEPIAPVSNLTGGPGAGGVGLKWNASPDNVAGYYVYRAASPAGPFTRLTGQLLAGTSYTDTTAVSGATYTYMVRAVALQTNPSGSYYDPSQGVFVTISGTAITTAASLAGGALTLTWNSQAGTIYRVLAATSLTQPNWTDISGSITATGPACTWTDPNATSSPHRYYRIASP